MIASDDTPVENVAQLSWIAAAFADWTMALSALIAGLDFENHPPMMAVF